VLPFPLVLAGTHIQYGGYVKIQQLHDTSCRRYLKNNLSYFIKIDITDDPLIHGYRTI